MPKGASEIVFAVTGSLMLTVAAIQETPCELAAYKSSFEYVHVQQPFVMGTKCELAAPVF
ncbi:MAG: hypothetical protein H7A08_10035 [Oceanospirillaceae bacterium]|nr:hypothetical protein [Oceanospirillaceae bacterium]MCP5336011.1 hypothetical protein [Oceanospirillaceae bacterium]MCP5350296.1 hypothetical protein [Oceanospirillaceae bacterium]